MEEPAEASHPPKKKRKYTLSKKALAARRANIKIAHQAPKELIYRPTEKRDAATMANLEKAIAGRNSPEGNERCRMNALKTGFYAHDMATSVVRLREDRQAFVRHLVQFQRLFALFFREGEEDEEWVVTLAQTCWRRLRLYPAQASWEQGQLEQFFQTFLGIDDCRLSMADARFETGNSKIETRKSSLASGRAQLTIHDSRFSSQSSIDPARRDQSSIPGPSLSPENTLTRAYCLPDALLHRDHLEEQTRRIWAEIVRLLQDFVWSRSDHQLEFHPAPPPHTAAYSKQVTRAVVAAIERHEPAARGRSSEVGEDSEVGIDDGESRESGVGNRDAHDGQLTMDGSSSPTPYSPLPTPVLLSSPTPDLVRRLNAVFLPADRQERSILRRIAKHIDHCFTRYAEEARRDADRLEAYLAAATEGDRESGVGSRESGVGSRDTNDSQLTMDGSSCPTPYSPLPTPDSKKLLALAQSLVDVLFPKTSLRDELDEIDRAIVGLLDELVRKRSGGRLYLEIHQPKDSLDQIARLIDGALADAPTK
ncbi:MAG TPA: hypothetical protein VKM93_14950 [Terriglobia bacterium]|nr:hypothetical protein [Terriglobia bacterium]